MRLLTLAMLFVLGGSGLAQSTFTFDNETTSKSDDEIITNETIFKQFSLYAQSKGGGIYTLPELTSVDIGGNVKKIAKNAFNECTKLTSITIPNSVTSIEDRAFRLTGLNTITLPSSITFIGQSAFEGCSNLTNVVIPICVTNIGGHAFAGCTNLTSITIPNGVTSIGRYVFSGCKLTNLTIPNSVTNIERNAFECCGDLTFVSVPERFKRQNGLLGFTQKQRCTIVWTK